MERKKGGRPRILFSRPADAWEKREKKKGEKKRCTAGVDRKRGEINRRTSRSSSSASRGGRREKKKGKRHPRAKKKANFVPLFRLGEKEGKKGKKGKKSATVPGDSKEKKGKERTCYFLSPFIDDRKRGRKKKRGEKGKEDYGRAWQHGREGGSESDGPLP